MKQKRWENEEDNIIKSLYGKCEQRVLMKRLINRTWSAIRGRAWKLGATGFCPSGKNRFEIKGDIAIILLDRRNGSEMQTIVSIKDLKRVLNAGRWHVTTGSIDGKYVSTQKILLHRFIMNPPKGMDVDHINGDTLLNTRENLRLVTRSENNENRETKNKNNKSCGIKNIHWNKSLRLWVVRVGKNKITYTKASRDFDRAVAIANEMRSQLHKFKAR